MGTLLEDIRSRAAALVTERNSLLQEKRDLLAKVEFLQAELAERNARIAEWESTPEPQPQPAPSSDPVVGERIRALVEEIDACIALMPHTRDVTAFEMLSA